jgi:hypothetical protein
MSIVPLPGTNGEFLATQLFMPGFRSLHAKVVRVRRIDGGWRVEPWMALPYGHRFDLLRRNGQYYFLGCILSGTGKETADWDSPGYLVAAELDDDFSPPRRLTAIATGMSHNHGYWRMKAGEDSYAYTACDQGVFKVCPPAQKGGQWGREQVLYLPVSDIAFCDVDGDGVDEMAAIEPFHGNAFVVYKLQDRKYREIYRHPHQVDFLHAIWGGALCGEPVFVAGCRASEKALFLLRHQEGELRAEIIEKGFGPSNVVGLHGDNGADFLLTANHGKGEAAVFSVAKNPASAVRLA